jgi:hypothetical protein
MIVGKRDYEETREKAKSTLRSKHFSVLRETAMPHYVFFFFIEKARKNLYMEPTL